MSIKNVRVANIRKEGYKNLKEWMADPNNVYIGRRGVVFIDGKRYPEESSPFANPYKINDSNSRSEVIRKYQTYIIDLLSKSESLRQQLMNLKNKNLGCWCHPESCHGDILMEILASDFSF
jgi:hypothetical protein